MTYLSGHLVIVVPVQDESQELMVSKNMVVPTLEKVTKISYDK